MIAISVLGGCHEKVLKADNLKIKTMCEKQPMQPDGIVRLSSINKTPSTWEIPCVLTT